MKKKLKKSEKLDLILSELAELRGEVKKLVRNRTALGQGVKAKAKSSPSRPKKLPRRARPEKKPEADAASSRPILVQAPQSPKPTSRTSS
jgi:hypothetical protein